MFPLQFHRILIIMLGLGLLTGCLTTASEPSQTIVAPEATATKQIAVSTASPIPPTISPTANLTPTKIVTPTPWPTLPPDEAANVVLSLLADNQNPDCLLPCWWGATPGQTRWPEIEPFLASFAVAIEPFPERSVFVTIFPVPESIDSRGKMNLGYTVNPSGIITSIGIASVNVAGYDPQTMMGLYGPPDEVWLLASDEPREGVLPFLLFLVYHQKGISFRYYIDSTRDGETVTACFEVGVVEEERPDLFPVGPRIYVWESSQTRTIYDISPVPETKYYPLETKTDLTPQTLYERFTAHPDEPACIDTPADLWRF